MKTRNWLAVGSIGVQASLAAYWYLARPWHRRWGATDEEVARAMPLDERVPQPGIVSTRAISIRATPHEVWQWIVQMGDRPRAGYYSYALIERMQGMEIENADSILPQYQSLQAGDALDKAGGMRVHAVEADHYLVLGLPDGVDWLQSTWCFLLEPVDAQTTRLVTRVRARFDLGRALKSMPPLMWPFWLVIDPGVFIMERKMLMKIKRLAESHSA